LLHTAILFVLFYAFWILMSGYFTPFLLGAGAASSAAVVWFVHRMDLADREGHPVHLSPSALTYWAWLGNAIMKIRLRALSGHPPPPAARLPHRGPLQAPPEDRRRPRDARELHHPHPGHAVDRGRARALRGARADARERRRGGGQRDGPARRALRGRAMMFAAA